MRILKTKHFAKWAIKNKVSDNSLFSAAKEIKDGAFDANYGGGVIKKRIATKGRKRKNYRCF